MKISVQNFKAIKKLDDYELKPLTIISGANSGGKSSLIQLILMIKQTLEKNSTDQKLVLNKPYVSLGKYKDIIFEGKVKNNLSWTFQISNEEIPRTIKSLPFFRILNKGSIKNLVLQIMFSYTSTNLYVQEFTLRWIFEKDFELVLHLKRGYGSKYNVATNSPLFLKNDYSQFVRSKGEDINPVFETIDGWNANIIFEKFFPYESTPTSSGNVSDYEDEYFSPLAYNHMEKILSSIFSNLSYLGPLRDEPRSYYSNDDDTNIKIGNKGEFAAHILEQKATKTIEFFKFNKYENGTIEFYDDKDTLENAVNYWICDVFKMATRIKVNQIQSGMMYRIEVQNDAGLKVPINHVGFGISQVLPIVVEGLISESRSILVLEQPEIHLHPNVQSLLFDFFYSLTFANKKVVIETHSDHLITRLRRRIAESENNNIVKKVNLTFIENKEYKVLELTSSGALNYWPVDFFDQLDKDIRAIVKAQGRKKGMQFNKIKREENT
jgi:predicted ATPase